MSAPAEPDYFAFISYSHQDQLWADWLHKALETYRVPRRLVGETTGAGPIPARLAPIFRDREDLASATDLARKVNAALARSKNLIVICSPHAAVSRWVNEEVLAFKRQGGAERIFCLIVGGEPNGSSMPGREAEECFAPALRYSLDASGGLPAERIEPIGADARAGKDGKANAKLKLAAGLIGVDFDVLKQRELHRRNRRLALLAAAALVVMAITTTLAITAVIARHDAERRQKQAEDLVSFMLGDLNDKLSQVHRLDIMQAVDDKAMGYFASLPTKDVTDVVLDQRVLALEKIGGVRLDQGQIPAALDSYQAAVTLAQELVQRDGVDPLRQATYADSLKYLGQAYWYRGDLDHALEQFRAAAQILMRVSDSRPGDAESAFKLAAARNDIGHVLESRGDIVNAATEYEATKTIYERLLAREPGSVRWKSRLGDAYNNLGKLALGRGELDRAIVAYRHDQSIKSAIAEAEPDNHDAQENLLLINAILGRTLGLCGELDAAVGNTQKAIESARTLMTFDPSYLDWQEYVGLYSQQLGSLLRQQGHLGAAAAADAEAIRVLTNLTGKDPLRAEWQQELAQAQIESARLQLAEGNGAAARQLAENARVRLGAAREKAPDSRALLLLAAQASLVSGHIADLLRERERAHVLWSEARDAVAPIVASGSDPNFLALYASALLALDQLDEARKPIGKLATLGYRSPDLIAQASGKGVEFPASDGVTRRIADAMK